MIRLRPINSLEASTQGFNRCVKQESAHCISWVGHPESRFTFDHVASEYITQARWTFWSHEFYVPQSCEHVCVCVPEERERGQSTAVCAADFWRILVTYRRSFSQWQDCQWWRIAWLGTTAACFVMARLAKHVEDVSSLCVMHIRIKDFLHLLEIVWWVVHACVSFIPWVGGRRVVAKHIQCSETLLTLTTGQVMIGAWLHVFLSISLPKFTWYEWQVFSFVQFHELHWFVLFYLVVKKVGGHNFHVYILTGYRRAPLCGRMKNIASMRIWGISASALSWRSTMSRSLTCLNHHLQICR